MAMSDQHNALSHPVTLYSSPTIVNLTPAYVHAHSVILIQSPENIQSVNTRHHKNDNSEF